VDAYTQALTWLARRELSERQVRERLAKREFDDESIDAAVSRLKSERALDDRRVALACARSAVRLKGRGRERVRRAVESLGISRDLARAAVDEVFGEIDESALIERALTKRWPRATANRSSAGRATDSDADADSNADADTEADESGAAAPTIDRRELQRIYQALIRQGFPADRVMQAIQRRRAGHSEDD
jgi:SOS response regulatory protein OraA/RecX